MVQNIGLINSFYLHNWQNSHRWKVYSMFNNEPFLYTTFTTN